MKKSSPAPFIKLFLKKTFEDWKYESCEVKCLKRFLVKCQKAVAICIG